MKIQVKHSKIQKEVIAATICDDKYDLVSGWLLPTDFDEPYRSIWNEGADPNRRILIAVANDVALHCDSYLSLTRVKQLAAYLIECRLRDYFNAVLDKMKLEEKDMAAAMVIDKTQNESHDVDIFQLIENAPEYFDQFTDTTKLKALRNYTHDRINKIK